MLVITRKHCILHLNIKGRITKQAIKHNHITNDPHIGVVITRQGTTRDQGIFVPTTSEADMLEGITVDTTEDILDQRGMHLRTNLHNTFMANTNHQFTLVQVIHNPSTSHQFTTQLSICHLNINHQFTNLQFIKHQFTVIALINQK